MSFLDDLRHAAEKAADTAKHLAEMVSRAVEEEAEAELELAKKAEEAVK